MKIGKYDISKKNLVIIGVVFLIIIGGTILLNKGGSKGKGVFYNPDKNIKIVKSEASQIEFEDFSNDDITLKKPKGWKVITAGTKDQYSIRVYDPNNSMYQVFLNLKTSGYTKSADSKKYWQDTMPSSPMAQLPYIEEKTTEGFFKMYTEMCEPETTDTVVLPMIKNFQISENLGKSVFGGDILRATFKDVNGKEGEGIFTAYVFDPGPYYIYEHVYYGKQIDMYYLNVYDTIMITTPKDKFIDWEETLTTIFSSLTFTDSFINEFNKVQTEGMKNFNKIREIGNEISDGIMDSWNKRNASFDIMSQKQSDATLGYERVYDTETNEVYKAYNGFTDDYDGERYKPITDDMYSKKTSGYRKVGGICFETSHLSHYGIVAIEENNNINKIN